MRTFPRSVLVVTAALLANGLLAILQGPLWLMTLISAAGPFLIVWMVLDVLRNRTVAVRDLGPDEDWGYQDRADLRPLAGAPGAGPRPAASDRDWP